MVCCYTPLNPTIRRTMSDENICVEQRLNSKTTVRIRHLFKVKSRTTAPSGFLQDISSLCSVKCPTISSALCHNGRHILRNHSHFYGEVSSMKVQMFMHAHMSFTVMCVLNVVVLEPGWVPVCGVQGSGVSPWHFRVTANTVSHWCCSFCVLIWINQQWNMIRTDLGGFFFVFLNFKMCGFEL